MYCAESKFVGNVIFKIKNLFSIDLRSLALFRVCLGILIITELITRLPNLRMFYTDYGVFPREYFFRKSQFTFFSPYFVSGSEIFQLFLFFLAGTIAILLLIGYKTKLTTFLSWYLLVSLQLRNPLINSGDQLLRVLLFFAIFLPLNACYSVDSTLNSSIRTFPKKIFSFGTVAYLLQITLFYFFNCIRKTGSEWHEEGSAVYYALSIDELTTSIGRWLWNFPEFLKILTHLVWWLEFLGPILLFIPIFTTAIRLLVLVGYFFMLFGFGLCLNLGIFPWVCIVSLIPFISSWFWDKLSLQLKIVNVDKLRLRLSKYLKKRPLNIELSYFENLFLVLVMLSLSMWFLAMTYSRVKVPLEIAYVLRLTQLNLSWSMFAPRPSVDDGWYVIPGRLKGGTWVDLFKNAKEISWKKPLFSGVMYQNFHQMKYMYRLRRSRDRREHLWNFSNFLCRNWNSTHSEEKKLEKLIIYFMRETTLPDYKKPKIEKILLWRHSCTNIR